MKRRPTAFLVPLVLAALLPATLFAQAGLFNSAEIVKKDAMRVGADVLFGSVGFMGHARYGASDEFDIGVRTGILRESGNTRFQIGFDGRYGVMSAEAGDAADINVVALFNLSTGQSVTQWVLGVGPQIGTTIPFSNSDVSIAPHAAVLIGAARTGLSISNQDIQEIEQITGQKVDTSSTDFGLILPLGAEIVMNDDVSIFGEVDVDIDGGTDATAAFGIIYNYR